MLNIFRDRVPAPNYRLATPPNGEPEKIFVKPDVSTLRANIYSRYTKLM